MSDETQTPEEVPTQKVGPVALLFSSALSDEENARLGGSAQPAQRRHGSIAPKGTTMPPKG